MSLSNDAIMRLKAYAFDWDDNLVYMPTPMIVFRRPSTASPGVPIASVAHTIPGYEGSEGDGDFTAAHLVSTSEFASIRALSHEEQVRLGCEYRLTPASFQLFVHPQRFMDDLKEALDSTTFPASSIVGLLAEDASAPDPISSGAAAAEQPTIDVFDLASPPPAASAEATAAASAASAVLPLSHAPTPVSPSPGFSAALACSHRCASLGPSWPKLLSAVLTASPFFIVTARGQAPSALVRGLVYLIRRTILSVPAAAAEAEAAALAAGFGAGLSVGQEERLEEWVRLATQSISPRTAAEHTNDEPLPPLPRHVAAYLSTQLVFPVSSKYFSEQAPLMRAAVAQARAQGQSSSLTSDLAPSANAGDATEGIGGAVTNPEEGKRLSLLWFVASFLLPSSHARARVSKGDEHSKGLGLGEFHPVHPLSPLRPNFLKAVAAAAEQGSGANDGAGDAAAGEVHGYMSTTVTAVATAAGSDTAIGSSGLCETSSVSREHNGMSSLSSAMSDAAAAASAAAKGSASQSKRAASRRAMISLGFSDDDPRNVATIEALFRSEVSSLGPQLKLVVYDAAKRGVKPTKIVV